ncbi:MAG: ATP-binding protein, partial [Candidatus Ornithospirochaeta sp.]
KLNGLLICSAEIPGLQIGYRPCFYKGKGIVKGSCIRVGDADLQMTDFEVYSYEAFKHQIRDDERIVERVDEKDMDQNLIDLYIQNKRLSRPLFTKLGEKEAKEMLNITRQGKYTLSSVLNFSLYPQGFFPQLSITAIVVPGNEIGEQDENGARFVNNKRIEGTIREMLEEAVAFCSRNMKVKTVIDSKSGIRSDYTEYPITAIREAILNALIHRDYSPMTESIPIQICFFADRLEIHSPGTLYGRLTIEQLGHSKPELRNPTLAVMAEVMTSSENRYSGIPTIRREMEKNNLPAPVFENRRGEFVVTLYNSKEKSDEKVEEKYDNLLEFCVTPRTKKEISEYLGLHTISYVVDKFIMPLVNEGKLELMIPDKPRSSKQRYRTTATIED